MDAAWSVPELSILASPPAVFFNLIVFGLVCLLVGSLHPPFRRRLRVPLRVAWSIGRQVLGWILIIIGILGMILPGPGIPFFILGVLLIGRRHPLLRRGWVTLRLYLRALARRPGRLGRAAHLGRNALHQVRSQVRPLMRSAERPRRRTEQRE
jgi:hypothetical protein